MNTQKLSVKLMLSAVAFATLTFVAGTAAADDEFSFQVTNNTNMAIKQILVSEDNSDFGHFDIGGGIKAGATVTLVWDKSTNGESCDQYFKAVFANGEESEAVEFDFCESEVALEFE